MLMTSLLYPLDHPNVNVTDAPPTPYSTILLEIIQIHSFRTVLASNSCLDPSPIPTNNSPLSNLDSTKKSDHFSLCFNSTIHQHLDNLTDHRLHDFLYGAGSIDILTDIILPNVHRLRHLDCVLSNEDHSRFLLDLPEAVRQSLEDVDITFVNIWGRPTSTFVVHSRYTFAHRPSDSHQRPPNATCQIKLGLAPLHLNLPWTLMKKIDMGTTIIFPIHS
ncbi:hypothetical protein CPB84DRAFT_1852084 [Gymnopilus junonius]|uniref:Uncharacterized protein n=1 Tax=Gymnopilus junonius TaxID=109634 RepID=A0A9P5NBZ7_GYMJU|nr:hypothetical protein CPB84DRAFT_1852084 [Gymnopilus junonius]